MVEGLFFFLKDKTFYFPTLHPKYAGNPINIAKRAIKIGYKLLHIIDKDLLVGSPKNVDIYDKLTYFIHVQTLINQNSQKFLKKLREYQVRVLIKLDMLENVKEDYVNGILIENSEDLNETNQSLLTHTTIRDIIITEKLYNLNRDFFQKLQGKYGKRIFLICENACKYNVFSIIKKLKRLD